jgi:hypothetical protein
LHIFHTILLINLPFFYIFHIFTIQLTFLPYHFTFNLLFFHIF